MMVIIGIDGGDLRLILRWERDLPNLSRMIRRGVYGRLRTTIPPATVPAWNCIFTGKNPGKIGIFDFMVFPFDELHGYRVANCLYQDGDSLWDIVGRYGKTVGVVNVPSTFPPKKVNGLMVSGGLLAPAAPTGYAYPPELGSLLDAVTGGYESIPLLDLTVGGRERETLLRIEANVGKHTRALTYILQQYKLDLLIYVFQVTDMVQHYFWHYMDRTHPRHDPRSALKYGDAIKQVYQMVDEAIGTLIRVLPEDSNIVVISDHGTGPHYGEFLANEWLASKGMLRLRTRMGSKLDSIFRKLLLLPRIVVSTNPRVGEVLARIVPPMVLDKFRFIMKDRDDHVRLVNCVDWSKTKAYALGSNGSIFVNLKGREPNGIVVASQYDSVREEIARMLVELKDKNGQSLKVKVLKKEEIFWGRHLEECPDLWYIIDDYTYFQRVFLADGKIWNEPKTSGGHSLYGVFIGYGPQFRNDGSQVDRVSVYDISPTVLHIMGLPIPKDFDGRVLVETLRDGAESALRPISYSEGSERVRISERIESLRRDGRL